MATKRFLIEVKEGRTKCDECLLRKHSKRCPDVDGYVEEVIPFLRCIEYNLATMKIKELKENESKN